MNQTKNKNDATFNSKAVVKETGLKPDTLRAWERRYGLPKPQRTAGGHRLYSQRDIDTLNWLIVRQQEGLSISRAVNLWQKYVDQDQDPLLEMPLLKAEVRSKSLLSGSMLTQLRESWIDACADFDQYSADNILSQALAMYAPEVVCFSLLQKGLSEIGVRMYTGHMSVQQVQFSSALAMQRIDAMSASTAQASKDGRIIIGCASDEFHTFPGLLLSFILRRRGWEVTYLGPNVPLSGTLQMAEKIAAKLVVQTAQMLPTAANLLEAAKLFAKAGKPFAFGGFVFDGHPSLPARVPGHYLGDNLEDAPLVIEQLLTSPRAIQPGVFANEQYQCLLQSFMAKHSKIESIIWDLMQDVAIRPNFLAQTNHDFGKNICAALTFGDIDLLGNDLYWVEGLLMNKDNYIPANLIQYYVSVYREATNQVLGCQESGQILINWLDTILSKSSLAANRPARSDLSAENYKHK